MNITALTAAADDKLKLAESLMTGVITHIARMPVSNLEIALQAVRDARALLVEGGPRG